MRAIIGFIAGMAAIFGAIPNAASIAEKWQRRTSQSSQDYTAGVNAVTVAPGQRAAEKRDKYLAGIQNAVEKWATNVAGVSLADWKRAATTKGASRLAEGVQQAAGKVSNYWQKAVPILQQIKDEADAMPDTTLEQRIAKANFVMRAANERLNGVR